MSTLAAIARAAIVHSDCVWNGSQDQVDEAWRLMERAIADYRRKRGFIRPSQPWDDEASDALARPQ